jgi:hypothetical protein
MRASQQAKEDKAVDAMRERGFRTRAAILVTVEQGAQKFANATGVDVHVWGVQGGYEARSTGRGEPSGSKTLIRTVSKQLVSQIETDDDPLGTPKPPTKVKPVNGKPVKPLDGAGG